MNEQYNRQEPAEHLSRLADPELLLTDLRALYAQDHHIHPPEAAQRLGVPESALVACHIGKGAIRLKPDMSLLLKPIADWDTVLCAFSNTVGHLMPLDTIQMAQQNEHIQLSGSMMEATINNTAIKDTYLFIDNDKGHGITRSIQFFDATGHAILKVFLLHKSSFAHAEPYLHTCMSDDQTLTVSCLPDISGGPELTFKAANEDNQNTIKNIIDTELQTPGHFELQLLAKHASISWSGKLNNLRADDTMFHCHEKQLRAHFHYAAIHSTSRSHTGALILNDAENSLLQIDRKNEHA